MNSGATSVFSRHNIKDGSGNKKPFNHYFGQYATSTEPGGNPFGLLEALAHCASVAVPYPLPPSSVRNTQSRLVSPGASLLIEVVNREQQCSVRSKASENKNEVKDDVPQNPVKACLNPLNLIEQRRVLGKLVDKEFSKYGIPEYKYHILKL
ncbi:hypothetical protein BC829DRAFT_486295 [Chytridium lagenaria]|nr:hypothetical protein BC829DRAFT_486295 [Chytridium lagenaria]